jgi:hypothetical protein
VWPFFDPAALEYAEAHKFPFSIGEIVTGAVVPLNATAFIGPALVRDSVLAEMHEIALLMLELQVISGDGDQIYCESDCYGVIESVGALFPKAKTFEAYVHPHTGHGINLHYNASGAYEVIQNFFKAHA